MSCLGCGLRRLCFPGRFSAEGRYRAPELPIRRSRLARGAALFRPGERVRFIYTLRSGCIKETAATAGGGRDSLLAFYLPGEVLGMQHAGAERFTSTAVAVEATTYCEVPWSTFRRLCAEVPEARRELVRVMARAAQAPLDLVAMIRHREALGQLAGFLLNVAARLRSRGLHAREFRLSLSRAEIADYLGMTGETVSRCFTELAERGLIDVRAKHVQLLQPLELQRLFPGA